MKLTVELKPQLWDFMTYCSKRECMICHTDSWTCIKTCPTHKSQYANTSRNRRNLSTIPDKKEKVREVHGSGGVHHGEKRRSTTSSRHEEKTIAINRPPPARACLPRPLLQRQDDATTFGISIRYIQMNISRQYCVQQIRPNKWHTARKSHE